MTSNDAPHVESSKVVASQSARAVDDQLIEELVGRALVQNADDL
ncbi:hypothetical protein OG243_05185 [Streptomyces sp. NBC_01318]|nr:MULTISPECIES: hypothetical protein [unclassified Streptomyces]WSJ49025.1 hypothetical protein OG243_05185 [Streptomyces sp. NBC_01318]